MCSSSTSIIILCCLRRSLTNYNKASLKNYNNDSSAYQSKSLEEITDQRLPGEQNVHIHVPATKYMCAYILLMQYCTYMQSPCEKLIGQRA